MADQKITQLTALGEAPNAADIIAIVDDIAGTPVTKKLTIAHLFEGLAANGANSDITSLSGLTTDLSIAQGGTGASTASAAASNLGLGTEDDVEFTSLGIGGAISAYNSLKVIGRWSGASSVTTAFYAADKTVNANETNYGKAGFFDTTACDIGSGYTDSGYRIALHVDGYIEDADFEGTLTDQYGLWARSGINAGTGTITNSYGAKIDPICATGTITNLYGLYIKDTVAGGTVTNEWSMYIANDALSYFAGTVSALAYIDRTKGYTGDALEELKKVKNKGKGIDHSTLPEFARTKVKSKDKNDNTIEEDGRDLGAMVSVLTVAVQQLTNRLETLEAK